jgi:hypothetical protein
MVAHGPAEKATTVTKAFVLAKSLLMKTSPMMMKRSRRAFEESEEICIDLIYMFI